VSTGRKLSSVTAVLRGGARGGADGTWDGRRPAVLLRGDMDALPVTEATGLPYASRFGGVMHACGHDLHTAMLAGAARLLSERRAELPGDVIFMFQPGEEGYAGADKMIGEGVLDAAGNAGRLPRTLCTSLPPSFRAACSPRSRARCWPRPTSSGHRAGRGGHASQPHLAADPIVAACEMVTALQALVTGSSTCLTRWSSRWAASTPGRRTM